MRKNDEGSGERSSPLHGEIDVNIAGRPASFAQKEETTMKLTIMTMVAILTAAAAGAHPHEAKGEQRDRKAARMRAAAERLDLTGAQREQMRVVRERDRDEIRALRQEMARQALEYRRLRERRDPRAEEVQRRLRSMKEEISVLRLASRAEIAAILTPEQRERLETMRERRRDRSR